MYGLELRALVWGSGESARCLETFGIERGERAVVVADAATAAALADAVLGITPPVGGDVLVDGADVTGRAPAADRVALLPAGGGLLPHLSVARNLDLTLDRDWAARARAAHVRNLAREYQLDGALEVAPHLLSREQQLRVALARAMSRQPAVLLVEDRVGEVSCGPVVRAAMAQNVAVLIVTDSAARAGAISPRVHGAQPLPADEPVRAEQEAAHAGEAPADTA